MVNVTPRVGCPYLQGRTSDTFNEGFAFVGRNLAINNASVAGKMYISRISAKDSAEQYGMYINVSTAGYTTLGTNSAATPNIPSFEIATGGTGLYAGSVIIDSASMIQFEALGDSITADAPFTITHAGNNQLLVKYDATSYAQLDVDADGSTTLTTADAVAGSSSHFEVATGRKGDIVLDSASRIQLESGGAAVTSDAPITVTYATADEKFRIAEDASNYAKFEVAADGYLTISSVGTDADLEIVSGTTGDIILDATNQVKLESAGGNITADATIESSVTAGTAIFKFAATSDVPTATTIQIKKYGGLGASYAMSTDIAGWLEVDVGGSARYIPFWA